MWNKFICRAVNLWVFRRGRHRGCILWTSHSEYELNVRIVKSKYMRVKWNFSPFRPACIWSIHFLPAKNSPQNIVTGCVSEPSLVTTLVDRGWDCIRKDTSNVVVLLMASHENFIQPLHQIESVCIITTTQFNLTLSLSFMHSPSRTLALCFSQSRCSGRLAHSNLQSNYYYRVRHLRMI